MSRSLAAVCLALLLAEPALAEPQALPEADRPKQLLLISFDGAHDNALWEKSRDIARRSGAHFTYFLSCTTLIPRAEAKGYKAPGKKAGRSNIGFAPTVEDVATRLDHIWNARLEGHEIANHACGHFDGKDWSKADWLSEFETFRDVVTNAWKANGLADREPQGWAAFARTGIRGFRAPYLSAPDSLVAAENEFGFAYDASLVTKGAMLPDEDGSLVRFGLPLIPEGPQNRRIIGMDYNLFVRHSAGMDNPSQSQEFEARSYAAFKAAFDKQYEGERIPLQLGFHFVEMNGGAYWRAMERLVTDVCHRADVACVSYSEAIDLLAKQPASPRS
ncbi:MAG: polysaccharide deacetylase [Rhizobium sp.]|nr:polysaccharide deacetylase [Rhizobium sp.]